MRKAFRGRDSEVSYSRPYYYSRRRPYYYYFELKEVPLIPALLLLLIAPSR